MVFFVAGADAVTYPGDLKIYIFGGLQKVSEKKPRVRKTRKEGSGGASGVCDLCHAGAIRSETP